MASAEVLAGQAILYQVLWQQKNEFYNSEKGRRKEWELTLISTKRGKERELNSIMYQHSTGRVGVRRSQRGLNRDKVRGAPDYIHITIF